MRKLSANISTGWNSRFQHSGLSARLLSGSAILSKLQQSTFDEHCLSPSEPENYSPSYHEAEIKAELHKEQIDTY